MKFIKKQVWIDNITLWVLENFRDKMAKKSYYVLIKMGVFFKRVDKDVLLRKRGDVTSLFTNVFLERQTSKNKK